jgi:hypothetical protein
VTWRTKSARVLAIADKVITDRVIKGIGPTGMIGTEQVITDTVIADMVITDRHRPPRHLDPLGGAHGAGGEDVAGRRAVGKLEALELARVVDRVQPHLRPHPAPRRQRALATPSPIADNLRYLAYLYRARRLGPSPEVVHASSH